MLLGCHCKGVQASSRVEVREVRTAARCQPRPQFVDSHRLARHAAAGAPQSFAYEGLELGGPRLIRILRGAQGPQFGEHSGRLEVAWRAYDGQSAGEGPCSLGPLEQDRERAVVDGCVEAEKCAGATMHHRRRLQVDIAERGLPAGKTVECGFQMMPRA